MHLDFTTKLKSLVISNDISRAKFCRYVEGADLFVCGNYTFNHYRDCQDLNYFLCADKINDVICLPTDRVPKPTPILACQDRVLRVLEVSRLD